MIALPGMCPPPLDVALRLILVTTAMMETQEAKLQLFNRSTTASPWQSEGPPEPAVVGKAGLGWGSWIHSLKRANEPEKFEGDKRTPAGIFAVGPSFGFSEASLPRHIRIQPGETVCVEDPDSTHYNTITTRAAIGQNIKIDEMARTTLYRKGLFIDYPTDRAERRGSCIFIHIWQGPGQGTAGCVALPEERVSAMQEFTAPGAVIAILPEVAIRRFGNCLPFEVPG